TQREVHPVDSAGHPRRMHGSRRYGASAALICGNVTCDNEHRWFLGCSHNSINSADSLVVANSCQAPPHAFSPSFISNSNKVSTKLSSIWPLFRFRHANDNDRTMNHPELKQGTELFHCLHGFSNNAIPYFSRETQRH
ncbi:MAG: hypothetical protein ACYDH9_21360, partial [Limisphaerales bacterium]